MVVNFGFFVYHSVFYAPALAIRYVANPVRTRSNLYISIEHQFYEAPFYYKTPYFVISQFHFFDITKSILLYKKMDFLISKKRFSDITKSNLWYQKIITSFRYHKMNFVITNSILWYHKIYFLISQNHFDFFYIKKLILWYQKNEFLISKNRFCDITKSDLFFKMILWYQ